jgi:hypothetical protein
MKTKSILLGVFLIGILFLSFSSVYGAEIKGDNEIPDDDQDGVDDEFENDHKRDIEIWIGENVVEMGSIKRNGDQKDIIELRLAYNIDGIFIRVSYGTIIESESVPKDESPEHDENTKIEYQINCEYEVEYKLTFEVWFRGLIEYIDLNENGVLDEENDEIISDYGFNSFHPVDYSLESISSDSNLHYIMLNTTDGIFTIHFYLVEEFVYVDETLISPTEAKIDIEITNYNYLHNDSQLALSTKLWSDEIYREREETVDEKEGYATDEKEVFTERNRYSGFFSWKETALIDGIEMKVLTKELDFENEDFQKLLICYPRGNHIYHDPKIGIIIGQSLSALSLIIITGTLISIIAVGIIVVLVFRRRRIL